MTRPNVVRRGRVAKLHIDLDVIPMTCHACSSVSRLFQPDGAGTRPGRVSTSARADATTRRVPFM